MSFGYASCWAKTKKVKMNVKTRTKKKGILKKRRMSERKKKMVAKRNVAVMHMERYSKLPMRASAWVR